MVVYFDESYDNEHNYMLYGALFVPSSSTLHQRIDEARADLQFSYEIKYTRCKNPRVLRAYKRVVDEFIHDDAYFRCVVVDQHRFDYSAFGRPDESLALKQARAYKKFAEMLLAPHLTGLKDAVFLADGMTRCHGDEFLERIAQRFNPPGGKRTFRHLAEVRSGLGQYQCLQVCDLLLGCVLNNLKPTRRATKNDIRTYLCERLRVGSLLLSEWASVPLADAKKPSTKFNVWYWKATKKPR